MVCVVDYCKCPAENTVSEDVIKVALHHHSKPAAEDVMKVALQTSLFLFQPLLSALPDLAAARPRGTDTCR